MSRLTLALSTASPALSLALFDGAQCISNDHRTIGRGHAEALMPAIAALLAGHRRADAILVDIGPGSFTGIRIGIAAARALGLAWNVPVNGFSGAALAAAKAFAENPEIGEVRVLLDGGRGQTLVCDYRADLLGGEATGVGAEAISAGIAVAGAGAALLPPGDWTILHNDQPDTRFAMRLPAAVRSLAPVARYLRPPDAVLPM